MDSEHIISIKLSAKLMRLRSSHEANSAINDLLDFNYFSVLEIANGPYEITLDGFQEVEHANPINLEERLSLPLPPAPPPYVEIDAVWDKTPIESGDENNILGGNGLFLIDTAFINVPVVEASDETLAYYGGRIVQFGDVVEFPDDDFPIWAMNLGENYVKDFVMTQKGGGMYLEYHCDRPHFHMPLTDDARGYLILGKKTSVIDGELQKFKYHLTAFKIPFGKGVYTYKCTVHADPALIGTAWLVGYDNAKHYSTVLVREKDTNEKVTINFIEQ